jgi:hypothetical protein
VVERVSLEPFAGQRRSEALLSHLGRGLSRALAAVLVRAFAADCIAADTRSPHEADLEQIKRFLGSVGGQARPGVPLSHVRALEGGWIS